jgi:leucyl aminopeptidase (aminopeptidase T)
MTELSATAPLKNFARTMNFRGATMPGFTREMIPALALDYMSIDRRVHTIKSRMDRAVRAIVDLQSGGVVHTLNIDLRYRVGHASGGLLREPGTVGNLPSGEAYIVPYEGEKKGVASETSGVLPVQFGNEIVLFRISQNRVVKVESDGPESMSQRRKLEHEPAYGNIAELGIGVLGEWGVTSVGKTLLDEKLGLHIAFGRSDHFGGATGPGAFTSAATVEHTDWVYVPTVQPHVVPHRVRFVYPDGAEEVIMDQGIIMVPQPQDT